MCPHKKSLTQSESGRKHDCVGMTLTTCLNLCLTDKQYLFFFF